METIDLLSMRKTCDRQRILLCFNGALSRSLLEEIGEALRRHLQAERASPGAITDVFAVYIEMTQNIRHYAQRHGYNEVEATATIVIGRDAQDRYTIQAGNLVEPGDGEQLLRDVAALGELDQAQLKAAYKTQLRRPHVPLAGSAGLGLIDMARRSSTPLRAALDPQPGGRAFFSLHAAI